MEEGSGNDDGTVEQSVSPIVRQAHKLLYRRMRIGVEDGRVFVGRFHCLDKQGNIILHDTVEHRTHRSASSQEHIEQRSLGLVLIPAHCRISCAVECSLLEQFGLLSIHKNDSVQTEDGAIQADQLVA